MDDTGKSIYKVALSAIGTLLAAVFILLVASVCYSFIGTTGLTTLGEHPDDYNLYIKFEEIDRIGNAKIIVWTKQGGYEIDGGVLYLTDYWTGDIHHQELRVLSAGTRWSLEQR